jgi:succinate-semialdehyde dehydrogenase/glutarate-semialdehyde dehydrogenase
MAGNTLVLRHASNVPGCATAIARLFAECDMLDDPDDIFGLVFADKRAVSSIIEDARIKAVSVTGSPQAGSSIAATAGAALKKTVLELGGSDPYLILADADVRSAARECAKSRLINSGQSCVAAKRFVVVQSVLDEFTDALIDELGAKRMGDPLREEVDLGPLAHTRLRDKLHAQVTHSVDKGAQCLLGGRIPDGPGAFYPPTVLTAVAPGMPVYDEEVFGPVAAIIAAGDTNDAVRIANDTVYGLGAAVFTSDREFGESLARDRIRAGVVCVNTFVRSDPRLPFGGIERSGYGRELGSFGIKEFVNTKVVHTA